MEFARFPLPVRIAALMLLGLLAASVLLPFGWMIVTSFRSNADFMSDQIGRAHV